MVAKSAAVVLLLSFCAVLTTQSVDARALQKANPAAAICPGVANTVEKMKNMEINKRILATGGSDILFGPFTSAPLVIFLPTDAAWMKAFAALRMNAKKLSTADNNAIGALFFYNTLKAPGASATAFGQPSSLFGKTLNSALGIATKRALPLKFTRACAGCSVFATGSKNRVLIKNPIKVCNSLIYVTNTVLLPSTARSGIPLPALSGLLALVPGFGK